MAKLSRILGLAGLSFAVASTAVASEQVFGDGLAKSCQESATAAASSGRVLHDDIAGCDLAIETQAMTLHDLAATRTNRGILKMVAGAYRGSLADFDAAIEIQPQLGGAHADRGAALIAEQRFAEGIEEIDRGLALLSPEPEKAYFNRALARERSGDIRGAYFDFVTASKLKPDWAAPQQQLVRFKVTSAK